MAGSVYRSVNVFPRQEGETMAAQSYDFKGLKCPIPVLRLTNLVTKKEVNPGDTVTIVADCPTFEKDIKEFCTKFKKVLVRLSIDGEVKTAVLQM
jgi:tRNA 2-thiouridine synthesizing protein A